MSNLLSKLMTFIEAGSSSSFLSANMIGQLFKSLFSLAFAKLRDFLYQLVWWIGRFLLGIMEALEYTLNQFLGIGTSVQDIYNYLTVNDLHFLSVLAHTLRAILAVSIILVIIFTIFSLIRQDWKNAFDDAGDQNKGARNDKKKVLLKSFKNVIIMFMLPVVMLMLISGVNSILTSFSNALKQGADVTVAGQVLTSSTYDTNRYRQYAEGGKRIPIALTAYNAEQYGIDQKDQLKETISDLKIQKRLLDTARMYADGSFLNFKDSLEYKNNMLVNSTNFGEYYETFICTPEQYRIMADFVDYAELHNVDFYVKAIDEKDIDWRYVDSSIFDPETNTLKIAYRDATDLNSNNDTNDSYTVTYQMSYNVTSPISDAFKSLLALLGVDEYSDNLWKEMERQEDSVNLVNWANEKVLIRLSEGFEYTDKSTWTDTDQIIMYEFYHYEVDNNDLGKYSIEDLKNGVEFDAYQIAVRNFVSGLYTGDTLIDSVLINDSYYRVELSDTETDNYGNKYYLLSSIEGVNFLENEYTTIEKMTDGETMLKFSSGKDFDIHNFDEWEYSDQILIYEYYRYSTNMGDDGGILGQGSDSNLRKYYLSSYKQGVPFNVYKITTKHMRDAITSGGEVDDTENSGYYVKLNYTYYQVERTENNGNVTYKLYNGSDGGGNFLSMTGLDFETFYIYSVADDSNFGADTGLIGEGDENFSKYIERLTQADVSQEHFDINYNDLLDSITDEQRKEKLTKLCDRFEEKGYCLSDDFAYNDTSTWTYRDLFIFYLYLTYPNLGGYIDQNRGPDANRIVAGVNIDGLKINGLPATLGYDTVGKELYVSVSYVDDTVKYLYLPLEKIMNISEKKIKYDVDIENTYGSNKFYSVGESPLFYDNIRKRSIIYSEPVATQTFNLSQNFNINQIDDWTVGDLILYSLSVEGQIQNLTSLQSNGYRALVFESENDRVYRIGGTTNTGAEPLYIADSKIKELKDSNGENLKITSVESWFNIPLLDFICRKYCIEKTSLYVDIRGIVNSIYNSSFTSNILLTNNVIDEILAEKGFGISDTPDFTVTTNIQSFNYSRPSSVYSSRDLSTWTLLDFVLYYLDNGSVTDEEINVYVIDYNNAKYITVNNSNKCIRLDDNISLTTSYVITATSNNTSAYSNLIHTSTDSDFKSTLSSLYLYIDTNFTYKYSGEDNNLIELALRRIYDENGRSLVADDDLSFQVYATTNGINKYLKVAFSGSNKAYYIEMSPSQIYFRNDSTLKLTGSNGLASKPFSKQNPEKYFVPFDQGKYSFMDAIYMYYKNSRGGERYDVYSDAAGNSYFVLDNTIVRYYDNLDTSRKNATDFVTSIKNLFTNDDNGKAALREVAEKLYSIYEPNFKSNVTVNSTDSTYINKTARIKVNFDITDISTWSPLELILYFNGYITEPEEGTLINTTIDTTLCKDFYDNTYIEINQAQALFIMLGNICTLQDDTRDLNVINLVNSSIDDDNFMLRMYMNIILMTNPEENSVSSVDDVVSVNSGINTYYDNLLSGYVANYRLDGDLLIDSYVKKFEDLQSRVETPTDMVLSEPTSWSYFGMLYYKLTRRTLSSTDLFYHYVSMDGEGEQDYIMVTQTTGNKPTYYFKISTNKFISQTSEETVTFGSDLSTLTPLTIVVYALTNKSSVLLPTYNIAGYEFKFLELDDNHVAIKDIEDATLNYAITDADFSYEIFPTNTSATNKDAFTWDLFEYLLLYKYGSMVNKTYSSKVYYVAGKYYFNLGKNENNVEQYMDITQLIDGEKMHYNEGSNEIITDLLEESSAIDDYLTIKGVKLRLIDDIEIEDYVGKEYWRDDQISETTELSLSDGFKYYDPSTWTFRDFIVYYMFMSGEYFDGITNFQEIVNYGYKVLDGYIIEQDAFGNMTYQHVLCLTSSTEENEYTNLTSYLYYDSFFALSSAMLYNYSMVYSNKVNISIELSTGNPSTANTPSYFKYSLSNSVSDFKFNEYYYFNKNPEYWSGITESGKFMDGTLTSALKEAIQNGDFSAIDGDLNMELHEFKLSPDFNINDQSTWTIKDLIILVEYANKAVISNEFDTSDFTKLSTEGISTYIYRLSNEDAGFMLNGVVYSFYYKDQSGNVCDLNSKLSDVIGAKENPLNTADDSNGNIAIYTGQKKFSVSSNEAARPDMPSDCITFKEATNDISVDVYMHRDSNLYMNYQVILDLLNVKSISPIVREVNWPQKLINDMQVLYPDLNWNTLLATQGWLDTLGEFSSAYTNGTFISDGNSSNITAAGLVLSEFFLSVATESEFTDLSDFTYSSIFDADTIKALMLAMLGEYEYNNVYRQAQIFMEMFNTMFAPVLDDIAAGSGFEIKEGNVENLKMCVYKSYLATVLLGSDMGEYFYKIATRVYAQYTIYESFAIASNDYANYYAYINNLRGDDGKIVKAFMYSSFEDLVKYENQRAGLVAPTYTFNYNNAFQRFKDQISGAQYHERDDDFIYYDQVISLLDKYYSGIYTDGQKTRVGENDALYCFMLDAYWSIVQEVGGRGRSPVYAELYHDFVLGKVGRWDIVSRTDVTNAEASIQSYNSYKLSMFISKAKLIIDFLKIYLSLDISVKYVDNIEEFESDVEDALGDSKDQNVDSELDVDISTPYRLMKRVFENSTFKNMFDKTFKSGGISTIITVFDFIIGTLGGSESGNRDDWLFINEMYENLGTLSDEFANVMKNQANSITQYGSFKVDLDDSIYESTFNKLNDLKADLDSYISIQNKIDAIVKASITFTLKEYGQNYVPDGYRLNIGNKTYSLRSATTSTRRLAEYVYGGAFLVKYGVYPQFTDEEFEGFVTTSKEYDSDFGFVRTRLNIWQELREFASSLADYTARLYYLSNFNDLASNVSDAVYLTDYVKVRGEERVQTIEQMIIKYLVNAGDGESKLATDTLLNLLYKDTSTSLSSMTSDSLLLKLAEYASTKTADASFTEESMREAISRYVDFVASGSYTSAGAYRGTTQSERMHEMFKSIISYLLINEETEEEEKKTIDLEDITFKDLKMLLIKNIVEYKQNPTETAIENSARYLAIFNLINCQVNYYYLNSEGSQVSIGTTIGNAYMTREFITDKDGLPVRTGNIQYKLKEDENYDVLAEFSLDTASRNLVIEMAGIPNRPIESLVNLEYDELYDMKGNYDEANGDTFILCYYDDNIGKYIPYLSLNDNNEAAKNDSGYVAYKAQYPFRITSDYCPDDDEITTPMPIVAKGMITTSGKPTAIKVEDYKVKFYRTDVIASLSLNDDAMNRTMFVGETNTVKYVNYVNTTVGSRMFSSMSDNASFISESNISFFVNSDINPFYIQETTAYSYSDEDGKISVLDKLAIFFAFDNLTFIMIAIGISATMPVLFKGTLAVLRRILDLLVLTLMGPPILAMNTMDYEEQRGGSSAPAKAYQKWRDYITQTLLFVFGYVIGLNVYYIIISTVTKMTFVSAQTVQTIQSIGGLRFLSSSVLNFVVKFLFIAVAAGSIQTSADLLINIVTAGKVTKAFDSPMGGDMKEKLFGDDPNSLLSQAKNAARKAKDIYSGKALVEAGAAAKEFAKRAVPGSEVISKGADLYKKMKTKASAKGLQKWAEASGIPPEAAKQLAKEYEKQTNEQRETKQKIHKNRVKSFTKKHEMFEFLNDHAERKPKDGKDKKNKNKKKKKIKKKK